MGIRDRPVSPRSPWQNAYAERLIGTVRRECLDRVLVFGEAAALIAFSQCCGVRSTWQPNGMFAAG
jgi:hypothetical protein